MSIESDQILLHVVHRQQPSPLLYSIDIWPACNSRLTHILKNCPKIIIFGLKTICYIVPLYVSLKIQEKSRKNSGKIRKNPGKSGKIRIFFTENLQISKDSYYVHFKLFSYLRRTCFNPFWCTYGSFLLENQYNIYKIWFSIWMPSNDKVDFGSKWYLTVCQKGVKKEKKISYHQKFKLIFKMYSQSLGKIKHRY